MRKKEKYREFWVTFKKPRVLIFILGGIAIIFLTFLTENNAFEIVISGLASIFIGIGVNNFSSFETHLADERQLKNKIKHSLKVMQITRSRINMIHNELGGHNFRQMKDELAELEQIISLSISLISDEEKLD
jgi:hypothetical protein